MTDLKYDKANRMTDHIKMLGIALLVFILLASIAGAAPFAYIPNYDDTTVSIIDTASNTVTDTVYIGENAFGVAVNPTGTFVYFTTQSNENHIETVIFSTATNTSIGSVKVGSWPAGVAVSPDGKKVYVSNTGDDTVSVIDTATNSVKTVNKGDSSRGGIVISPDGKKVYEIGWGWVYVIDTETNTVLKPAIKVGEPVGNCSQGVAISPDGKYVFVAEYQGVSVIDTENNTVTATVHIGSNVNSTGIAISPDGNKLYVANEGYQQSHGNLTVIDLTASNSLTTIPVGSDPNGVSITPDGKEIYVANGLSNTVSVIDSSTNSVIATLKVGSAPYAFGQFIGPLTAQPGLPIAGFNANITSGYAPLAVQFNDISKYAIGWNWSFGDGTNSNLQNTSHTYFAAGNYIVNLTASNANGTNSKLETITVLTQSGLPTADFIVNSTSGDAPLSVQFTDFSQKATGWYWDFGDKTNSTDRNTSHTYSSAGSYVASLTVSNANGTSSKNVTITVNRKSASNGGGGGGSSSISSGGGGGGGGGGSPENQSNVELKELSQAVVTSGKAAKFDFIRNETCVVFVSFDAKKTLGKTTTLAEQLKGKSSNVLEIPEGEVYKYFNVWVGNGGVATPENIGNDILCFKVDWSWLQDKKIDPSSIALFCYGNKKWEELPIKMLSQDSKYLYFTAYVSGYSYFAIVSKTNIGQKNPSEQTTAKEQQASGLLGIPEHNNTDKPKQGIPGFEMVIEIACLIVAFWYRRK